MLPQFPDFKRLDWQDRQEIEQITGSFPPYSDFNFISLWAWDTTGQMNVTTLYGNVVVLFRDYVTDNPFLSFIGNNRPEDTASALIDYSIRELGDPCLKLVPECVAQNLPTGQFSIIPDGDSHDYILSVSHLCGLADTPQGGPDAAISFRKYKRVHPGLTTAIHSGADIPSKACLDLFRSWASSKGIDCETFNEYAAFVRFVESAGNDVSFLCVYDGPKLIAFIAYEFVSPEYVLSHFAKADTRYKGIYEALNFLLCREMASHGIRYLNFEQDLGIPSLRNSKLKFAPCFYLKKFIVQKLQP